MKRVQFPQDLFVRKHGGQFIVLYTNMAIVTSCENDLFVHSRFTFQVITTSLSFLPLARPSPPSFLRVLRPVNHDAMLLGWSLPEMDEFGRSNNLTVKGYKVSKAGYLCL